MLIRNPIGKHATGVFYCLLLFSSLISGTVKADAFITTDQNPFSLFHGLPLPVAAVLPEQDSTRYYLALESTNTLNSESNSQESLLLDFESYHLKTGFEIGLSDGWAFRFNLPFIARGGGTFDNAIDDWHDFFSLPRADRPNVQANQFQIRYISKGKTLIDLTQPYQQLGDIQISLGKQLTSNDGFTSSLWSTFELPTGDAANLSGSKNIDFSMFLASSSQLNTNWNLFSNFGVLLPGKSSNASLELESRVWFGHIGTSWSVIPELDLQIQVNGHTGFYKNSRLRLLNSSYELIFGGSIHIDACSDIDVAFSEDIKVGAAPDISLMVSWRSQLGSCI